MRPTDNPRTAPENKLSLRGTHPHPHAGRHKLSPAGAPTL